LHVKPKEVNKKLLAFIIKEFNHVLRDYKTLFILFGMPIAQILIFGFALSNEIRNTKIVILDNSKDEITEKIINRIEASQYFDIDKSITNHKQILEEFKKGGIKLAVVFPQNFGQDLFKQNSGNVQIISDATDPNTSNILISYVSAILRQYQMEINDNMKMPYQIDTEVKMLYNPQLKSVHNFVPGVIAMVLMLLCVIMTSISIVKEKELGTMEILLVSPFNPLLVIISKAIPYFILSVFNLITILVLSVFVLDLDFKGSLTLFFGVSFLFIICCLTFGILISSKTDSQQSAMFISQMGMMLPTILLSGFMFPIENMPIPLQIISNIIPAKWFYIIMKSIIIKGLGFTYIWKETLVLLGMTVFLVVMSLKSFKIRLN
jgi:ABC-2 type transport system permease protein